ncbi:hypothetical protein K432DRAFT_43616 [Lepidopterella palustris CBS 459.81]|uniref:Uncharacterized protein n=1 Tax=Lepidopterella palustris CBS 459.81 TaxID=1314670 RepID=A0A8E2EB96_9PEZI|nr:hypothetical protein K432DRAFT_43616 [Lepidopterella palustris CBS 459.81]
MTPTNPRKRPHASTTSKPRSTRSVRIKLSPSALEPAHSSTPSSCSVSEDSALFSTSHSGTNSTADSDPDSDTSSELSESSEDPSSESESEGDDSENDSEDKGMRDDGHGDEVITLPLPKKTRKPEMRKAGQVREEIDLGARLKGFLPMLAAANEELEMERLDGRLKERDLEAVDEDAGGYIEMDLGLGVLEEKDPDAPDSRSESDSSSDENVDDGEPGTKEKDILSKLLGRVKTNDEVGIQVVEDE